MSRSSKFLKKWAARRAATRRKRPARFVSGFESLEPRLMLAVTAFFVPQAGILTVLGDDLDNSIEVSRNAAGNILVNGAYSARVTVVDRVVDAASGLFGVRLELPNRDSHLPAGLKCKVRLP